MPCFLRRFLALVILWCGVSAQAYEYTSADELSELRSQMETMQQRLDELQVGYHHGASQDGCAQTCCPPAAPTCRPACGCGPGFSVSAEYLYWKLYSDNLHFAWLDQNNLANFGDAQLIDAETNYDSGYRLRAAYQTESCWEIAGVFSHYDTTAGTTVVDPDGGGGVRIRDTRLPVNGPNYASATGQYSLDLDLTDLEFARWCQLDCPAAVRLFGGFRYADVEQQLSAQYNRFGGGTDRFDELVNAQLYGLRVGSEGWWCFCSGLGLYGRLAGSVLVGTVRHDVRGDLVGGGIDEDPFHEWFGAVPVLEAAAGVSYRLGPLEVAAGWEGNAWLGLSKSMRPMDDVDETRYSHEQFDLILAGWTFRASYLY